MSTATQRKRKRPEVHLDTKKVPTTQGEEVEYISKCAKWLKTKMDNVIPLVNRNVLCPYRHSAPPKKSGSHSDVKAIIRQSAFDFLPQSTTVLFKCTFCEELRPSRVVKNPYTRLSWQPLCAKCNEKSYFH